MEGKLDPLGDAKIELRVGEVEKIHIFIKGTVHKAWNDPLIQEC